MARITGWLRSAISVAAVVCATAALPSATPAYAAPPATTADFNGDGYADLVVGLGLEANAVQVVYGSADGLAPQTARVLSQDTARVPGTSEADDSFGVAVAVGDFDGDGYTDAAIGAPGESVGGNRNAGSVTALYGSSSGLRGAGSRRFTQDSRGVRGRSERGDRFGTSVTVGDFNGDRRDDLAVGVPGERIRAAGTRSGSIELLYGSSAGLTSTDSGVFSHKTAGMTDSATSGGGVWGPILVADDFDGDRRGDLAVGVPGGYVKDVKHGGFVQVLYGSDAGISPVGARRLTRATAGVPGAPGQGLPFGLRIAAGDFDGNLRADLAVNDTVLWGSAPGLDGRGSRRPPVADAFTVTVLRTGDITGDGRADLLLGGRVHHEAEFGVLPGAADGFAADVQTTAYPVQPSPDTALDVTQDVADLVVLRAADPQEKPLLVTTDAGVDVDWSSGTAYAFRGAADGVEPTPVQSLTRDNTRCPFSYQPAPLA